MNIAYISADLGINPGSNKGGAVHIREMIAAFNALGHTVVLFTLCEPSTENPIAARICSCDATMVDMLSCNKRTRRAARELLTQRSSKELAQRIATYNLPAAAEGTAQFDFIFERYSLFSEAGLLAANYLRIPFFLEVNSPLRHEQTSYRSLVNETLALRIERRNFQHADRMYVVSDEISDYVESSHSNSGRIELLPNAVNTELFQHPPHPYPRCAASTSIVIGFVGSLKPWHGLDVLLDAFVALLKRPLNVHLLIVGGGTQQKLIEEQCRQQGISSKVTFTGWQPHRLLPGILATIDIAVAPYPALPDFYFSPLKLYEYLAAGKAVIASDIGQISSVITHLHNGYLVPAGNHRALTQALFTLGSDARLCTQLGQHAMRSMRPKAGSIMRVRSATLRALTSLQ